MNLLRFELMGQVDWPGTEYVWLLHAENYRDSPAQKTAKETAAGKSLPLQIEKPSHRSKDRPIAKS